MAKNTLAKVCVVGAGSAGSAAALEASAIGAEVTVIERSERVGPSWKLWPALMGSNNSSIEGEGAGFRGLRSSVGLLTSEARSCLHGTVATTQGQHGFDRVILATGSSFDPPAFQGSRKPGVFVLDSPDNYEELGRRAGSLDNPVVCGEGVRALQVAEKLAGSGKRVRVVVSRWHAQPPSPPVLEVIFRKALEEGVTAVPGTVQRAVGLARVEAVVVDGYVVPCDSLAFVPDRVPRNIAASAVLGHTGGVIVDRTLATSDTSIGAAGGCSELKGTVAQTLEDAPVLSGRIAGSNCLGARRALPANRTTDSVLFGLRWTRMGLRSEQARKTGVDVETVSRSWGNSSACEIVFERSSKKVVGIESASSAGQPLTGQLPVVPELDLEALAYGSSESSDISLVSETARLGLVECRGS